MPPTEGTLYTFYVPAHPLAWQTIHVEKEPGQWATFNGLNDHSIGFLKVYKSRIEAVEDFGEETPIIELKMSLINGEAGN